MNTGKTAKLKNINLGSKTISQKDDEENVITLAFSSLTICLKPEDDFPHPRHLCFQYPFGKSSPKRHCSKCYCYVCEELAPCKLWKKTSKRHCEATGKDDKWKLERKLRLKLPQSTTMAHHQLTISAFYDDPSGQQLHGILGVLISNDKGEWIYGLAKRFQNNVDSLGCPLPCYIALLEGLELAWSRGFQYLQLNLGYMFHTGYWFGFSKDAITRKYQLSVKTHAISPQTLMTLKAVEDYLNREWVVEVKYTKSIKEKCDVFSVIVIADIGEQFDQVYDFKSFPLTEVLMDVAKNIPSTFKEIATSMGMDGTADEKKYLGLS